MAEQTSFDLEVTSFDVEHAERVLAQENVAHPNVIPAAFSDDMPIGQARDRLRAQAMNGGGTCPVCTQRAQVYRRKLSSRMAATAIKMLRAGAGEAFVHLPTVAGDGCEGGKLRYWGLAVEESARRPDGGRSGWWMLTEPGVDFVHGRLRVRKYAEIYDSRCLGLEGEPVAIRDCLGDKFDYAELMAA